MALVAEVALLLTDVLMPGGVSGHDLSRQLRAQAAVGSVAMATRQAEALQRFLRDDDHEVASAASGEAAWARLEREGFDLVLTDLSMPGMDGLELLRRVREAQPDVEVVVITAHGKVDSAVEAIKLGAENYLTKPLEPGSLIAVVERAMEKARLMAEAAVLREGKRWKDAYEVLGQGAKRFSDDADVIYEQAMVAEKLERMDDMEKLLRRVIALKPDNAHAHNALGYSLADRRQRLPEARDLIRKALDLSPGEPFITDSLGWVEFRLGNHAEAARLLRQAYASRPDVEIGAHLGEVLWVMGQRDEARRIWRDAQMRDSANEVLKETLARLQVGL